MSQVSDVVKRFFADFERGSNAFERDLLASLFSDPYMAADPDGGIQVVKRDDFIAGIAKRQAFFQSIGFQHVRIDPVDETQLAEHYVMVKARVIMRFKPQPGQAIDTRNDATYILFIKDDAPKIVFNLTHGDIIKMMREHGMLPGEQ